MSTAASTDLTAVKARQQATWASGDYAEIATLIVPVAERLVDAADIRAGWTVLDVATGSGNAAIAAARAGAIVTGVDYVDLHVGDAEALAFHDASFDATLSVFGSMFAPDHRRTAAEILRVTRPGGTIGLASWTPDGFIGAMFRAVGAHVPPPSGLPSPTLWGTEEHLAEIFGDGVIWTHRTRTFTFRFASAAEFVERFGTYYGPTLRAIEAAGGALERDLEELALEWNRLERPGPIALHAEYLESVGVRA